MSFRASGHFKTPTCTGVKFKDEMGDSHRLSGELYFALIDDDSRMYFSGTYRYWVDNLPPVSLRETGVSLRMFIKNIIASATAEDELIGRALAKCLTEWHDNIIHNDSALVME